MKIVRYTNPDGTYRYEVDGRVHTKAGKKLYTHASVYKDLEKQTIFPMFHTRRDLAVKGHTMFNGAAWQNIYNRQSEIIEIEEG